MEEQERLLHEALQAEYKELSSGFRVASTIRLGILTFVAGLVGWMADFIFQVYSAEYTPLRAVIPLTGLIATLLIMPLEARMVRVYDLLLARGVDIEKALHIVDGTYQRLDELSRGPRLRVVTIAALILSLGLFGTMLVIEMNLLLDKGE